MTEEELKELVKSTLGEQAREFLGSKEQLEELALKGNVSINTMKAAGRTFFAGPFESDKVKDI